MNMYKCNKATIIGDSKIAKAIGVVKSGNFIVGKYRYCYTYTYRNIGDANVVNIRDEQQKSRKSHP
ncbi:hypothetical protein ACJDU8_20210 [Clostridium sp. WILCCON 0269]|uniref:Uncharacterized protein n=1 Tax=Candidatus Clostridium eludens TaxID=3381663 RepID=A0ABW8SP57_9CLOT